VALPAALLGAYFLVLLSQEPSEQRWPWLKAQLRSMHLVTGLPLLLAIAAPWYVAMVVFDGRDPEGLLFWQRFFVHDHFKRLLSGVHSTTPGGTFTYFIEQTGYGIFPWVALVPGALNLGTGYFGERRGLGRRGGSSPQSCLSPHTLSPHTRLRIFLCLWVAITFALFTSAATKFHHYILPMLPGLAGLIGLYVDRLWRERFEGQAATLLAGAVLLALVGRDLFLTPRRLVDLFTYNYDRPYPLELLTGALHPSLPTVTPLRMLALCVVAGAGISLLAALRQHRAWAFFAFWLKALGLAVWFSWSHWVDLSHHWTQRDLFWRYHAQRRPDEPIAAFLMDWKGETFYSRNQVIQLKAHNYQRDTPRFVARPGREWVLSEHSRVNALKQLIGPNYRVTTVDPALNNKFVLLRIE
jgi:4-amino-4-deoxy-L-arabinose transferase-like glycosyltransferase